MNAASMDLKMTEVQCEEHMTAFVVRVSQTTAVRRGLIYIYIYIYIHVICRERFTCLWIILKSSPTQI